MKVSEITYREIAEYIRLTEVSEEDMSLLNNLINIAKAYDYIYLLSTLIDPNNEVLDDFYAVINPLAKVLKECETEKVCPFCNHKLYLSDLPQYDYVCAECDENFYESEVK